MSDIAPAGQVRDQPAPRDRPAPLRVVSLSTQAYERLRRQITEGELPEGAPLVIAGLVRSFGISHTPVREALARLHAEGLASFVGNVGYRVAARPSEADLCHWMEARLAIEVSCAEGAARRAEPGEIASLSEINAAIRASAPDAGFDGVRRFSELNAAFHRTVAEACRNPFLRRAYDQIWLGPQFSRVHLRRGTGHDQTAEEHERIIAAIRARDAAQAGRTMAAHIIDSLTRDLASVEE